MWVEKNGMFGNSERRTQQWFKMVEPPGEARDDCWQLIALARRLYDRGHPGMRDADGRFLFHVEHDGREVPIWDFRHYYDVNVDAHLFDEYLPMEMPSDTAIVLYSIGVPPAARMPALTRSDNRRR